MKGKLVGFALALLSVATIGLVQVSSEALKPGQINNTPRCTAKVDGMRSKAFTVNGTKASVKFKVTGQKNCRVQLSAMAFFAPSMNGKPWNKQILFDRTTKVYGPGTYQTTVNLPKEGNKQKGCFYQVDLTYGKKNHLPVIAYGHGKLKGCEPKPKPSAVCKDLSSNKLSRTQARLTAHAATKNGAKINGYEFTVRNQNGAVVDSGTRNIGSTSASFTTTQTQPGTYTARVVVKTSVGERKGSHCVATFKVPKKEVKKTAVCKDLTVETIKENEQFKFTATAEVTGGATISSYDFVVSKNGTQVDSHNVATSDTSASHTYTQTEAGNYDVQVTVNTSLGARSGADCKAHFKVEPKKPGVKIEKYVENKKYTRVGIDAHYDYQIKVTNTGEVNLIDAVVTDTPEAGITLVSASQGSVDTSSNTWSYTIPELKVGESLDFVLTAKVPVEVSGRLTNTVCVDTTEVPGQPDDCDEAEVDVEKVPVCDPETGEIIMVDEKDASNYEPVDSPKCADTVVCNPETGEIITVKQSEAANYAPVDSDACKEAPVCNPETGEIEIVRKDTVDQYEPVGSDACEETAVCNPETGEIETIRKDMADQYAPVDSDACKETYVCNPETGKIELVQKDQAGNYQPVDSDACKDTPEQPPVTPETPAGPAPTELPQTGAAEVITQLAGAMSLAGAGAYYYSSRRLRA